MLRPLHFTFALFAMLAQLDISRFRVLWLTTCLLFEPACSGLFTNCWDDYYLTEQYMWISVRHMTQTSTNARQLFRYFPTIPSTRAVHDPDRERSFAADYDMQREEDRLSVNKTWLAVGMKEASGMICHFGWRAAHIAWRRCQGSCDPAPSKPRYLRQYAQQGGRMTMSMGCWR